MNPPPYITLPDGRAGYNMPDGSFVETSRADYDAMVSKMQNPYGGGFNISPMPNVEAGDGFNIQQLPKANIDGGFNISPLGKAPIYTGAPTFTATPTVPTQPMVQGTIPTTQPEQAFNPQPIQMQRLPIPQIPQMQPQLGNITMPQVQQQPVSTQTAPQPIPAQDGQGVIGGIQNALNTAQQDKLTGTTPTVEPKVGMSPGMRNSLIGLGANAVTGLSQTLAPDSYDQRVGMAKPGLGQFGNLQFTGMGASLGPVGAAVGFGVDAIKNTIGYFKHKQAFNVAENKADVMDWRNKMLTNQQPDYTGLAREGMEVKKKDGEEDPPWYTTWGLPKKTPTMLTKPKEELELNDIAGGNEKIVEPTYNLHWQDIKKMQDKSPTSIRTGDKKVELNEGMMKQDGLAENLFELVDITGLSSHDDLYRTENNPNSTEFDKWVDRLGVIPFAGKLGKVVSAVDAVVNSNQNTEYNYGGQAKAMVPVELERSETIVTQDKGGYNIYGRTPDNGPTHEQGGIPMELPEGALVFPKKYDKGLAEAMKEGGTTGDWSMMESIKNLMKKNAAKAYEQGKPYSSGGKP